jgi:hypothetical protein
MYAEAEEIGSPSWTRTNDISINSRMLYQLSYQGIRRDIAQGHFSGKAFLCFFTIDLVLSQSAPYCGACSGGGAREVHQVFKPADPGTVQPVSAGGLGYFDDYRGLFQLSSGSRDMDATAGDAYSLN